MTFIKKTFTKIKNRIEYFGEKGWHNWGQNQKCSPAEIFRPVNLHDLKKIVKKAKQNNKKIRCAAAAHSWSSLSVTSGYLVIVTDLNDIKIQYNERLKTWTVTTEAGVYLKDLDKKLRNHDPPLTMDSATVLNTVTTSGIVSTGSHGAKCASSNISDKVISFQIITSDGKLHEFSDEIDPVEMNAARINFGLLGIIYKLTFKVEPMFNLMMKDVFPNISDWEPENLKNDVLNCDSIEIFYWPFNAVGLEEKNDKIWVKTWKRTDLNVTVNPIEAKLLGDFQNFGTKFGDHLYEHMVKFPDSTPYITNLVFNIGLNHESENILQAPDAIHYQHGTDNVPCMDVEFAFKINHLELVNQGYKWQIPAYTKLIIILQKFKDFSNVIEEFNYIVKRVYELAAENKYPLNLTAEFRINKASKCLLAPTYDEDPNAYYCLMEILSVNGTQGFLDFSIELAKRWMEKYNAIPHWDKMWEHVPNIIPYLRNLMGKRLEEFEKIRAKYDHHEYFFDNDSLRRLLGK
ncbi:13628_t:CDS:2 [Cetraspora pellucida]|uniref:D-arabinono-1,4-lactone oxidase n=1 Tax=Cetraspora pellucida TaxID=1433469 RepID=A0A9N9A2Y1_9GLOM|nr:13628_t:CDS:2 [Cetraspora pellucida]